MTVLASLAALALLLAPAPPARQEARAPADPAPPFEQELKDLLASHGYFKKVAFTKEPAPDSLLFLIQRPVLAEANYREVVLAAWLPWLEKLEQVFQQRLAAPLGLERREDAPVCALIVLLSEGDYINYRKTIATPTVMSHQAHFDRRLGLTVFHRESGRAPHLKRIPVLNEFARALLNAYSPAGPGSVWLDEGLAGYLSYHLGREPATLDQRVLDRYVRAELVRATRSASDRGLYLFPVRELTSIRIFDEAWRRMKARAQVAELGKVESGKAWELFHGQAVLWMHFLLDGQGGKHRSAFLSYVKAALDGRGGAASLAEAFAGVELDQLDREFWKWVHGSSLHPTDEALIAGMFAGRENVDEALAQAEFEPGDLAPDRNDASVGHGLALQQARSGDLEGAVAALTALEEKHRGGPLGGRLADELARVSAFRDLRDEYLAELVRDGKRLTIEVDGRRLTTNVTKVEDGLLHLSDNRNDLETLPLARLDPYVLGKLMAKKQSGPNDWMRFYGYILAADERWERLLKGDIPGAKRLRDDAGVWYPGMLRLGAAAARLQGLAGLPAPVSDPEAEHVLAGVRELLSDFADLELVSERKAGLRTLASVAQGILFVDSSLEGMLHGKFTRLEGGAVRLTYEFDDPAELEDFEADPDYLKEAADKIPPLKSAAGSRELSVRQGSLGGSGQVCYRLPLRFSAPMTVRLGKKYGSPSGEDEPSVMDFVGICDDRHGSNARLRDLGSLIRYDISAGVLEFDVIEEQMTLFPGHEYEMEIRHDGETISTWLSGEEVKQLPAGDTKAGEVFFWVKSDPRFDLTRLEVEGHLDKTSLAGLRRKWVDAQLIEMGFDE